MRVRLRAVSLTRFSVLCRALGALVLGAAMMVPIVLLGAGTAGAQAPTTSVLQPSDGTTVSGNTWLDASAESTGGGVAGVDFSVTGGGLTQPLVINTTLTFYGYLAEWNTTSVPNGTYSLISVATADEFPLMIGTSSPVTITVNNQPPTMLVPSNGATVSGTEVVLDAGASAAWANVQFELTGGSLTDSFVATATPTYYGWIAEWNSTGVANGTYTLQSVATSGANSGTSAGITITIDNPSPSTSVIIPAGGATLDTAQGLLFDAVASPGVSNVSIEATANGTTETYTTTPTLYGWIAVIPGSPPCAGCVPISLPISIESVASYSGGVSGTSAPINGTVIVYVLQSGV